MKKLIIFIIIISIIIGGFLFFKNKTSQVLVAKPTLIPEILQEEKSEIEVSLIPKNYNRAVDLKISKIPAEVISIEYELSYITGKGLPRGVLGKVDLKGADSFSREILLGSCSKNVCVYDEGVKKISLTLKFNKSSGQATGFSKEYEL